MKNCFPINLPVIEDGPDGKISVADSLQNIPFNIKRVYYIYDLNNLHAIRGKHAHKELEQVIFCINGSFTLCLDDGELKENIRIDQRHTGIFLGKGLWHTMTAFSKDCVLLVLASDHYRESDYIRDYDEFLKFTRVLQHDTSQ
jgi:dTDP-4-dehydrorhamnose 3,5-epimerase-like enzyme